MTDKEYPKELNGVPFDFLNEGGQIVEAAWCQFCDGMQGRQYSYEATRDAWAWFLYGWEAHIKGPRHETLQKENDQRENNNYG